MSEPIATQPNIVHVSPEQVLRDFTEAMERVAKKYPGVVFITMVGQQGDASKLACLANVSRDGVRERLRNGLKQLASGRIRVPFRE